MPKDTMLFQIPNNILYVGPEKSQKKNTYTQTWPRFASICESQQQNSQSGRLFLFFFKPLRIVRALNESEKVQNHKQMRTISRKSNARKSIFNWKRKHFSTTMAYKWFPESIQKFLQKLHVNNNICIIHRVDRDFGPKKNCLQKYLNVGKQSFF